VNERDDSHHYVCNKAQTRICFNAASKIARAAVLLNKVSCASCATATGVASPATNLAGCTKVNGKGINHKYVPGMHTGMLLDLVVMLITDLYAKWTAGSPAGAPLASGARFSSRHCKGSPATPFPSLQMISITTSPINCFAPGRILAKFAKHPIGRPILSIVWLSSGIWWC
jgi:hypothetical protein